MNNSNPNLEKLTTQYYETFAITGRFTGYFSNITIGDFYNNLSSPYSDSTAILGGLNSTARQESSKQSESSSSSSQSSGSSSSSNGGKSSSSSSQTINQNDSEQISEKKEDWITNPEDLTAGTSSIVGDRGTENFGIAIFDNDKMCGELSAVESICHSLISNKVDSCIISINDPLSENDSKKIEVQIFPKNNTKVRVAIKDETPHISIELKITADIITLNKDINYETEDVISKISDSTKQYLQEQFNNYLNKLSKEYNVDIDKFSIKAPANFSTIAEWERFNWENKFKNTSFDVNIDLDMLSTMLITKT